MTDKERLVEIILEDYVEMIRNNTCQKGAEFMADAILKEFVSKELVTSAHNLRNALDKACDGEKLTASEILAMEAYEKWLKKDLPERLKQQGYIPIKDAPKYCKVTHLKDKEKND